MTVLVELENEGTYVFIEDFNPNQSERRNRPGITYI